MLHQTKTSTYKKLNLLFTTSIYFVFLPLAMQKRLKKTTVYHAHCYFYLKRKDTQTFQSGTCKTLFSRACVIGTTCIDKCFLLYVIIGRHFFSWKFIVKYHVTAFLWSQCFERSLYFIRHPNNSNMMLLPKFQNKVDYVS